MKNEKIKAGYKQTEVGVIPEAWEVKPLKTLAEKITVGIASAATHAYREKGVILFRNQNVKAGYLDDNDILHIDPEYAEAFKNKRLKAGDLLTARTGYPGTTCVVPPAYSDAQSFTTLITRPNQSVIDSLYLCQYINSEHGQNFFDQNQIGGGQKNVNAGSLREMPIPFPPISEQRAIAITLSDVDEFINGLDKLIAKKRAIKQATMQQLLTGKKRLPGFGESGGKFKQTEVGEIPEDWDYKSIGEYIDLLTGFPFASDRYTRTGTRLLRGSNVKRGQTDWSLEITQYWPKIHQGIVRYELQVGDLVIAMDGSLVGRSYAQVSENDVPSLLLQRVARIRSVRIDIDLLTHWVGSDFFVKYCDSVKTVTAIPHISPSDIRGFTIPLPSRIMEQNAIAEILSDMDSEITALEKKREKTLLVKQGMMQELLTGRIRLKGDA